MYINNFILSADMYETIHFPSRDIVIIEMCIQNKRPIYLVNINIAKGTSLIEELYRFLRQQLCGNCYGGIMIAGDFNLHHSLWNLPEYTVCDGKSDELLDLMADNGLKLLLLTGTVTYPSAQTTIDLIWGSRIIE